MVACSCGNSNCKILAKKTSTSGTQTVDDITPTAIVISRSPSPSPSVSSKSNSDRSRSPSPTRKRKKRFSKMACKHVMLSSSRKLCYPPLRSRYARWIIKKKPKKKTNKKKKSKKTAKK